VEDCRHLSRRLERDLLTAGEAIVRVPTKMMAHARDSARTHGKSDPIDALAVARAALREPDLPAARLDDDSRQVRLLVDHREDLIGERTRQINRLRWHLHELDPTWDPPQRSLNRYKQLDQIIARLADVEGLVARLALELTTSIRELTVRINDLEREITVLVKVLSPTLLTRPGIGVLTAAKLLGETADVTRFRNKDAYARHTGTAPLPVVRQPDTTPPRPYRQPTTELRHPPHRRHSRALPSRSPRLLRTTHRPRQHTERSAASTQTTTLRPRLPRPISRHVHRRTTSIHTGRLT
jgi:transposase